MNVKKQVIENVKAKLENEREKLDRKLHSNCYKINQPGIENETMKREKAKLSELIKSLN